MRTEYTHPYGPLSWETDWNSLTPTEWSTVSKNPNLWTPFINAFNERIHALQSLPRYSCPNGQFNYQVAFSIDGFGGDIGHYGTSSDLISMPPVDWGSPYLISDFTLPLYRGRSYSLEWIKSFIIATYLICKRFVRANLEDHLDYSGWSHIPSYDTQYDGEDPNPTYFENTPESGPISYPRYVDRKFPFPNGLTRKYRRKINSLSAPGVEGQRAQLIGSVEWKATPFSYDVSSKQVAYSVEYLFPDYRGGSIFKYHSGQWIEILDERFPEADIITDYGTPLAGDIFGPWIMADLKLMLDSALVYAGGFRYLALYISGPGASLAFMPLRVPALVDIDYQPVPRDTAYYVGIPGGSFDGIDNNAKSYYSMGPTLADAESRVFNDDSSYRYEVSSCVNNFVYHGLIGMDLQYSYMLDTSYFNAGQTPQFPTGSYDHWTEISSNSKQFYVAAPGNRAVGTLKHSIQLYYFNFGGKLSPDPTGFVQVLSRGEFDGNSFCYAKIGNMNHRPPTPAAYSTNAAEYSERWMIGEPAAIVDFRGPNGFKYRKGYTGV